MIKEMMKMGAKFLETDGKYKSQRKLKDHHISLYSNFFPILVESNSSPKWKGEGYFRPKYLHMYTVRDRQTSSIQSAKYSTNSIIAEQSLQGHISSRHVVTLGCKRPTAKYPR